MIGINLGLQSYPLWDRYATVLVNWGRNQKLINTIYLSSFIENKNLKRATRQINYFQDMHSTDKTQSTTGKTCHNINPACTTHIIMLKSFLGIKQHSRSFFNSKPWVHSKNSSSC